jgi:predicted small secreted protein
MKTKSKRILWASALVGLVTGAIATKIIVDKNENRPDKILRRIQNDLKTVGVVGDSWISADAQPYDENTQVYAGIISISEGQKKYQLQFKADITNGEVVEMTRVD